MRSRKIIENGKLPTFFKVTSIGGKFRTLVS